MDVKRTMFVHPQLWIAIIMLVVSIILLKTTKQKTTSMLTSTVYAECTATVEEQIATADVVLIGSVFMIIPGGATGAQVIIEPGQVYKGKILTPTITINARDDMNDVQTNSDSLSRLHFQSGQPPYVLFLSKQLDGSFTTSQCAGTRFLGPGLTAEQQQLLAAEGSA